MTDKNDSKSSDEIEVKVQALTDELRDRLKSIDPTLVAKLTVGRGVTPIDLNHFSDWHDNWHDKGGGWSKTWGKAGGDSSIDLGSDKIFKGLK